MYLRMSSDLCNDSALDSFSSASSLHHVHMYEIIHHDGVYLLAYVCVCVCVWHNHSS